MANGQPPAGWYPDPAGDTSLIRYWDGQAWTAQTQPMVVQHLSSNLGAPLVSPQPVYAPGQEIPSYIVTQPKTDRKGFALAGFILSIVSVVFFCLTWVDGIIAVLAIVLSALGIQSSRKKMAIVGVILGVIGIIAAVVFFFILIDMMADPVKYGLPSNFFQSYGF